MSELKFNKSKTVPNLSMEDHIKIRIELIMISGVAPDFSEARKFLKLSLRTVEKDTGISNSYLSQMENRLIPKPSFETVMKLYNYYIPKLMKHENRF